VILVHKKCCLGEARFFFLSWGRLDQLRVNSARNAFLFLFGDADPEWKIVLLSIPAEEERIIGLKCRIQVDEFGE